MNTQPSAGALRAADAVNELLSGIFDPWMERHGHVQYPWVGKPELAAIIDRETGHAEMAAALRDAVATMALLRVYADSYLPTRDMERLYADAKTRGVDLNCESTIAALKAAGEGE